MKVHLALTSALAVTTCMFSAVTLELGQAGLAEDEAAEKREIAHVVGSVIGRAKTKDLNLFYGSIANDEDYISVTPGPRVIKRFEDVEQSVPFWMSPDFQHVVSQHFSFASDR